MMSLALCPQVVSQASQHFRSSEKQATYRGCFARCLSARSFSFTPACPGQYTHRICRRWMSTIDTCQSGLPIPLFTFCSKPCPRVSSPPNPRQIRPGKTGGRPECRGGVCMCVCVCVWGGGLSWCTVRPCQGAAGLPCFHVVVMRTNK